MQQCFHLLLSAVSWPNSISNDWRLRSLGAISGYTGIYAFMLAMEAQLDATHIHSILQQHSSTSPVSSSINSSYPSTPSHSQTYNQYQIHELTTRLKNNELKYDTYIKAAKQKLNIALQQDLISDIWMYFWLQCQILEKMTQQTLKHELQEHERKDSEPVYELHSAHDTVAPLSDIDPCIIQLYRYMTVNSDNPNTYLYFIQYLFYRWPQQQFANVKIQILLMLLIHDPYSTYAYQCLTWFCELHLINIYVYNHICLYLLDYIPNQLQLWKYTAQSFQVIQQLSTEHTSSTSIHTTDYSVSLLPTELLTFFPYLDSATVPSTNTTNAVAGGTTAADASTVTIDTNVSVMEVHNDSNVDPNYVDEEENKEQTQTRKRKREAKQQKKQKQNKQQQHQQQEVHDEEQKSGEPSTSSPTNTNVTTLPSLSANTVTTCLSIPTTISTQTRIDDIVIKWKWWPHSDFHFKHILSSTGTPSTLDHYKR